MYEKIINLYKKTRPLLNNLRNNTLNETVNFKGSLTELIEKQLGNCEKVRFLSNTESDLITILVGVKSHVLNALKEKETGLDLNEVYNFTCSKYLGPKDQVIYVDLINDKGHYVFLKASMK